jgi:hypothetical protein
MVRTFANDNPGATARILLVDGVLFREMVEFSGLTDGNPPSYVIAVGNPPDRSRGDIREMRRLARETKGRYYEARTPRAIEKAMQAIESRLRCDIDADDFRGEIEPGEPEELADTELDDDAETADVRVTWPDREDGFEIEEIDVIRDGDVVRQLDDDDIEQAYRARSATAGATGARGRRFRSLHLRRVGRGGRLRVVVRVARGRGGGTVYARVTQSRRTR